jgi:PleD family two-component response regulator
LFNGFRRRKNRAGEWNIMDKILVLSEDGSARGFLGMILQREHFLPMLANSREAALANSCTLEPDLLIMTSLLPVSRRLSCARSYRCARSLSR